MQNVNQNQPRPRHVLKEYQKSERPQDKKQYFIKEISNVLTELEELKKTKKLFFFSQIYKRKVVDSERKVIGFLQDLGISKGGKFPEVSHILVEAKHKRLLIPWRYVEELGETIRLKRPLSKIEKRERWEDDIFLGEHILDKQVVDVDGLKVIRVNDIALTTIKNRLAVVNIDIGTKSIFRRLGFEALAEILPFNISDHPIPWRNIEPLTKSEKIHLKIRCARVSDLHPADVAELFEELSVHERRIILKPMTSKTAAKVLLECEPDVQQSIIKTLRPKRIASMLENMDASFAANLLSGQDKFISSQIMKQMTNDTAERIQLMLSLKPGSAARYMSDQFIEVSEHLTVAHALKRIRESNVKSTHLYYVYITADSGQILGAMSLRKMIMADPKVRLSSLSMQAPVTVDINDPIEYVAELMTKYDFMALPVVDVNSRIKGIVNIDDILDVMMDRAKAHQPLELSEEAKEDLLKEKKKRFPFQLIQDTSQFIRYLESFGKGR